MHEVKISQKEEGGLGTKYEEGERRRVWKLYPSVLNARQPLFWPH